MTSDPTNETDPADETATGGARPSGGEVNDVVPMPQDPEDSLRTGDGVTGEASD